MDILGRSDKLRVEKNVRKVINSDFDETTIRSIYFDLRPYARKNVDFLEFADLVAHPQRNKGEIREWLNYFIVWSSFLHEYVWPRKALSIFDQFPKYLVKIFERVIQSYDDNVYQNLGANKSKLQKYFKKNIVNVENSDLVRLDQEFLTYNRNNPIFTRNINTLIKLVNNYTDIQLTKNKPCFTESQILKSIIDVLRQNNINFNEKDFAKQSKKIMLVILKMLHRSEYELNDGSKIRCYISGMEYEIKPDGITSKHLGLFATSDVKLLTLDNITVPFSNHTNLVSTSLAAYEWCDPSIFEKLAFVRAAYSDHELEISEEFKLKPILPYMGDGVLPVTFKV